MDICQTQMLLPQSILSFFSKVSSTGVYVNASSQSGTVSMTTPAATPSTYVYNVISQEEPKRRFTEVKQEDKLPENLLGYEVIKIL